MLNEDRYKGFNETDFICDRYFQDWVMDANVDDDLFWRNFFEKNPDKKEAGEAARTFLLSMKFKEDMPDENLVEASLMRHLADVEKIRDKKVVDMGRRFQMGKLMKIAAIFGGAVLIIAALLMVNNNEKRLLVKSEYGNIKSVLLPDSSSVVLNGNSAIQFSDNWSANDSREVWLEGEAFFNVRHINQDINQVKKYEKFIVHTDDLTVEVLGTSFDIRQRRGKTEVVLETGRIKVSFLDGKRNEIIMNPGDKLVFAADVNKLTTGRTDAENFSAWKEKKLLLEDPTAAEVIEYLEDVFGKDLVMEDPALNKRKIEGPILLTNLDDALFVLSTVLNAEIIRKDSTILIRPR